MLRLRSPAPAMTGMLPAGEILMLSHLAWKLGRSFTVGRADYPQEFEQVSVEVNGLSKALKCFAEVLYIDDGLLKQVNEGTYRDLSQILSSCQCMVKDLESRLDEHQTIRRRQLHGGYSVERSWNEHALANYSTLIWTLEGGDLDALMSTLNVHSTAISLTQKALESNQPSSLESIVSPLADMVDSIGRHCDGDLKIRLEQIQRIVDSLANGARPIKPLRPKQSRSRTAPSSPELSVGNDESYAALQSRHRSISSPAAPAQRANFDPIRSIGVARTTEAPVTAQVPISSSADLETEISELLFNASGHLSTLCITPSMTNVSGSSDLTLTCTLSPTDGPGDEVEMILTGPHSLHHDRGPEYQETNLMVVHSDSIPAKYRMVPPRKRLLSPVMEIEADLKGLDAIKLPYHPIRASGAPAIPPTIPLPLRSLREMFEKRLFGSSARLIEVRGASVSYIYQSRNALDVDFSKRQKIKVMAQCRVCVIKKTERLSRGRTRSSTSIWAFNNDWTVRVQQALVDDEITIPFMSHNCPDKIAVAVSSNVIFHNTTFGAPPIQTVNADWMNYTFADAKSSEEFQNAIMGRTLLGSYQTDKTVRLYEGITSVLAAPEQMCAGGYLRLWREETAGGVFAMIPFASRFRSGHLAFYLNSITDRVKISEAGSCAVKIRGLAIPASSPTSASPAAAWSTASASWPPASAYASSSPSASSSSSASPSSSSASPSSSSSSSSPLSAFSFSSSSDDTASPSSSPTTGMTMRSPELGRQSSFKDGMPLVWAGKKEARRVISGARIEFSNETEKAAFVSKVKEVRERMIPLPDLRLP